MLQRQGITNHPNGLSMLTYHRIIKVAHTIADIEASSEVHTRHLSEAIGYRRLDRRQQF